MTNFFNTNGGIPVVFGALTPAGLTQVSGETATGSQQTTFDAMNQFMGVMTDPFIAGRGDRRQRRRRRRRYSPERAMAPALTRPRTSRVQGERDAYAAIFTKAPPLQSILRPALERVGGGLRRLADHRRQCGARLEHHDQPHLRHRGRRRLSLLAEHLAGFALAGGGTNFSVVNGLGSGRSDLFQAGAFIRHTVGPAYVSARWPMAGRTSPPIAP